MYLQPYNNPRAGLYSLQRKMNTSTLNLATSREPLAPSPRSISKENRPQLASAGQSRGLHKARSLDVLSEALSQTQMERDASTSDGRSRSRSNTGNTSFSGHSSSSESSSSLKEEEQHQHHRPNGSESSPDLGLSHRRGSTTSSSTTSSSGSVTSKGSETASVCPRVPPRPKTEEIMTRCTTMTRKAALATKTQLQIQPESTHSR